MTGRAYRLLAGLTAAAVLAGAPALGAEERMRIRSDEELRAFLDSMGGGLERLARERSERLAERVEFDLDRVEVRSGSRPLAAGHELSVARQHLNSLKTLDPHNPAVPLLERRLNRADRTTR